MGFEDSLVLCIVGESSVQKAIELVVNGLTLRGMEHVPNGINAPVPAAILFHGYTGTKVEPHRLFVKISRALEAMGIASFRFDFSGSGESDGDFEHMTLSGEVTEAHAILDMVRRDARIDASRVMLIGLSMGGLVASLVAGDRPEDVHKLVLLAPAGNTKSILYRMAEAQGITQVDSALEHITVFDDAGNVVGKEFLLELLRLDAYPRAASYQGPVLIIHGSDDPVVSVEASHTYQRESYHGRATLHIIQGADHTFNKHEWEAELIQTILDFVRE
jgi:pimeloyl-ACP methyl ester carboxylesterase